MDKQLIARLLSETLYSDGDVVHHATQQLDRLSVSPEFPFSLLSLIAVNQNQSLNLAAATYLKNLIRRHVYGEGDYKSVSKQFKDQLLRVSLQAQSPILKVLVESVRVIIDVEFVKNNTWPEIVSDLKCAIFNSTLVSGNINSEWQTINSLVVLQALVRPFQYFLNPKAPKEPVPLQLELVAKEILVPLLAVFHIYVEKALSDKRSIDMDTEKVLLLVCKCIYFSVRSYMPSALVPLLPSFSGDLHQILGSISSDKALSYEDGWRVRLKTAKRSLLIFCALITRHRKYSDKLMPDMMQCVLGIVGSSSMIEKLDFLSERIASLAFDVISHVLETGPGWRLVSPYFSSLLDSAIFTALRMNDKDISEWEEDAEEFIWKNFPSDLEEASGWREDLFTARKSAINLLGVISMSKGPPVPISSQSSSASVKRKKGEKGRGKCQVSSMGELLVVPFLSKFPMPSDANVSDAVILTNYYGVLMGYGSLLDFLRVQKPEYTRTVIQNRVLPLYRVSTVIPYLIAAANWLLGELVCCLPEDMSADIYTSLLKALTMPDHETMSCYPVRATAAGAMATLLENDYVPPDWLPLLQAILGRIGHEDEETSMLFELLSSVVEAGDNGVATHIPALLPLLIDIVSKSMPSDLEPWPQLVERGFTVFAVMAKCWEDSAPDEDEQSEMNEKWVTGRIEMAKAFSVLLQRAWLASKQTVDDDCPFPLSCADDASTLLRFVMCSVTTSGMLIELKVSQLLLVWADLIANWHEWEEVEDVPMFDCIKEVVTLQRNFGLKNFFVKAMPSPPAPPVPDQSIIEGICVFVTDAISQYPSATRRACSCVHLLLHSLAYSFGLEDVKQSLVISFSGAAISHFKEIQQRPCSLWKPLLLVIASCYLCYPEVVEQILEKSEQEGFVIWLSALCSLVSSSDEPTLSAKSEIKLVVMALAKLVEQLLQKENPPPGISHQCFSSLLESCIRLKDVQQDDEDEESDEVDDYEDEDSDDDDDDDDDDEDSEEDVREETEEEFLERYAKAAAALENGTDDDVIEDEDLETELGYLEELDQQKVLGSLLDRYHQVLIHGQTFSPQLISSFMDAFPEYSLFFNTVG